MADVVKQMLIKLIQDADEVVKVADKACSFRQECLKINVKAEKLAGLLRQVARACDLDAYERPTRLIIDNAGQALDEALTLVFKCRARGLRRLFTTIHPAATWKISHMLEHSISDVSWLLSMSTPTDDRGYVYLRLPSIAAHDPFLCLIWDNVAILCSGSIEERTDAAWSMVTLARDNCRYRTLIIKEGGIPPLLKLAKEGSLKEQELAVRAICSLGRDQENFVAMVNAGAFQMFEKMLKEGHMKVEVIVDWVVSELAASSRP